MTSHPNTAKQRWPRRIVVREHVFDGPDSIMECARFFNVKRRTVMDAIYYNKLDSLGRKKGSRGVPCPWKPLVYKDLHFRSYRAASLALGMYPSYVQDVMVNGGRKAKVKLAKRLEAYRAAVAHPQRSGRADGAKQQDKSHVGRDLESPGCIHTRE